MTPPRRVWLHLLPKAPRSRSPGYRWTRDPRKARGGAPRRVEVWTDRVLVAAMLVYAGYVLGMVAMLVLGAL